MKTIITQWISLWFFPKDSPLRKEDPYYNSNFTIDDSERIPCFLRRLLRKPTYSVTEYDYEWISW